MDDGGGGDCGGGDSGGDFGGSDFGGFFGTSTGHGEGRGRQLRGLMHCPECGKKIWRSVKRCTQCQCVITDEDRGRTSFVVDVIVVGILVVVFLVTCYWVFFVV